MPALRLTPWLRPLLTLAALAGVLSLAACGGGNGAPNNPYEPIPVVTPLSVTPAVATTYSGSPFTFTVDGGTQPYTIISSDQAALPIVGTLTGNVLTVVPGSVGADTTVTLTVRDSLGATTSSAVTVKPALLLPASITITGNPNCSASGADLCSGQDGTATVQVTGPAGAPLASRSVRFDVVQGSYSISSTAPGQPLVQSLTVATDQNGNAAVRLVVPVNATTQIATIRATDVTDGSSVVGQFTIAQFVNGNSVLSVIPTGVTTFTGPDKVTCSDGGSATFYVFGGSPPYTVATNFPTAISLSGSPVPRSGAGFTITTNGTCFTGLTFAITDSAGRTLLTPPTADNVVGTAEPPPVITDLSVTALSPTNVANCASGIGAASFLVTGGTPKYFAALDATSTVSSAIVNPNTGIDAGTAVNVTSISGTAGQKLVLVVGDNASPPQKKTITFTCTS